MKLSNIFLTRVSSDTIGGLPGLMLTAADMGVEKINIHGPKSAKELITFASMTFAKRDELDLSINTLQEKDWSFPSNLSGIEIKCLELRSSRPGSESTKGREAETASSSSKATPILAQGNLKRRAEAQHVGAKRPRTDNSSAPIDDCRRGNEYDNDDNASDDKKAMGQEDNAGADPKTSGFCLIGRVPATPGTFNIKRARALGIKPGPVFATLKRGEPVECKFKDGTSRVVNPSEVVEEGHPPTRFAIIDCPDQSFLDSLVNHSKLKPDTQLDTKNGTIRCVVHLAPKHIIKQEKYKKWASAFAPKACHLLVHNSCCGRQVVWRASELNIKMLRIVSPQVFHEPTPVTETVSPVPSFTVAKHLGKFCLFPYKKIGYNVSDVPSMVTKEDLKQKFGEMVPAFSSTTKVSEYLKEAMAEFRIQRSPSPKDDTSLTSRSTGPGTTGLPSRASIPQSLIPELKSMRPRLSLEEIIAQYKESMEAKENDSGQEFDGGGSILFLGTGSAIPSKYRNVSAIYLSLSSPSSPSRTRGMLLDCGEGTYSQLIRRFGLEGTKEVLLGLNVVWISHMHADHHLGLLTILRMRHEIIKALPDKKRLLVIGPNQLKEWLGKFNELSLEPSPFDFAENYHLREKQWSLMPTASQTSHSWPAHALVAVNRLKEELGITAFKTVSVRHCRDAWAAVVELQTGCKIAYSGDCRPSENFSRVGRYAHILIHEATFDEDLQQEAYLRKHCTAGEAISVARRMRAEKLLLTHFSQRYPKIPAAIESEITPKNNDDNKVANNTDDGKACNDSGDIGDIGVIGVAFDMMHVRLSDLWRLPMFLVPFRWLFPCE
eukprot:CAMPEP_0114536278 /NCGR_PEP_ID=MMETSP0109-20121206/28902_1 /TAXON_ID=29199 /ORGANISM="Chlorarachnion reptans, Strain CCCM449" /LENGTH=830 /DNA_ID=CAMNT_0001719975 /DNA_START=33 /DNA_END=2526 /DNA_ORIENTATION=+